MCVVYSSYNHKQQHIVAVNYNNNKKEKPNMRDISITC